MLYKLKVKNKEYSVHAGSLRAAEAYLEKTVGGKIKEVEAPEYPEVETSSVPVEEVLETDAESELEWEEPEEDDEADA